PRESSNPSNSIGPNESIDPNAGIGSRDSDLHIQNMVAEDAGSLSWGLSEIPMHVGSPMIRPEDRGKIRAVALESAENQARQQMAMLRRQAEALMEEARRIEERLLLSVQIFQADVNFTPVVGQVYHLYQRANGTKFLSLIGPNQWGSRASSLEHLGTFKHLADSTWEPV
ncbi:MAG: DUF2452 domain-containing protein, partial [Bacteroidota bacterium]